MTFCAAFVLHLCCICAAFVLHLCCICAAFLLHFAAKFEGTPLGARLSRNATHTHTFSAYVSLSVVSLFPQASLA
jgi:hypothetical protein